MGVGSFLFGGKPGFMNESKFEEDYKKGAKSTIANALGATPTGDGQYDWSKSGTPLNKEQSLSGYDFSPFGDAMNSFKAPTLFGQKYNPYQFNFSGLPEQYAKDQYALGSKNVRRESAGNLKALNESLGPRNKGLLFKAAGNAQRAEQENLAGLNLGIRSNMAQQNADFAKAQQLAQAGENQGAFNTNFNVDKAGADERYRNANALADTAGKKLGLESDIVQRQRADEAQRRKELEDMYATFLSTRRGAGVQKKGGLASGALNSFAQGAGMGLTGGA